MSLSAITKQIQLDSDELVCFRCLERTSKSKAVKTHWSFLEDPEGVETYCPECTKIWNQMEEDSHGH